MKKGIVIGVGVTLLLFVGLGAISESEWREMQDFKEELKKFVNEQEKFVNEQEEFNEDICGRLRAIVEAHIEEYKLLLELVEECDSALCALEIHLEAQGDDEALWEITYTELNLSGIENDILVNISNLRSLKSSLSFY